MTNTWHYNMNTEVLSHKICAPASWSTTITKPRTTEAQVTWSFRITFISICISVSSRFNSTGCLKNTISLFKCKVKSYTKVMLMEKTLYTNLCQQKNFAFPKSTFPRYALGLQDQKLIVKTYVLMQPTSDYNSLFPINIRPLSTVIYLEHLENQYTCTEFCGFMQ